VPTTLPHETTTPTVNRPPAEERRAHARAMADAIRAAYGLPPADPFGRPSAHPERCEAVAGTPRRITLRSGRVRTLRRRIRRSKLRV